MFSKKCKTECFLKNNIHENLNHYTNKFNAQWKIKLYIYYIFSNLKYQIIIVKKIHSMPTGARLWKKKERKVVEAAKGCASVKTFFISGR